MKNKIRGYIELVRPELPFAAGICVVIGEITALGQFPSISKFILGFLWGFFLSSPAMILNDYFDIEVDKINAPERPLPSGLISPAAGVYLAIATTLIGLIVSYFISSSAIIIYIVFWLLGFLYNWKLKTMGLIGNLLVSSSVGVTIVFGGLVAGDPWNKVVWIISAMAFLFNLGEEIASDAMDIEGDRKRNVKSIAILIGKQNALRVSTILFMLMIIVSLMPYFLDLLGINYLIIISAMDILILFFTVKLLKSKTVSEGKSYIRKLYRTAIIAILALLLSVHGNLISAIFFCRI